MIKRPFPIRPEFCTCFFGTFINTNKVLPKMVCTLERCQFSTVLIRFTGNWRKISDGNFKGAAVLMDPRFNDSWFVFHNSRWSFHEPYFSRKHLFHESYRVNRTQDYSLKTFKEVPNYFAMSKTFLSTISTIIHFFIEQKFFKHHFYGAENNKLKSQGN